MVKGFFSSYLKTSKNSNELMPMISKSVFDEAVNAFNKTGENKYEDVFEYLPVLIRNSPIGFKKRVIQKVVRPIDPESRDLLLIRNASVEIFARFEKVISDLIISVPSLSIEKNDNSITVKAEYAIAGTLKEKIVPSIIEHIRHEQNLMSRSKVRIDLLIEDFPPESIRVKIALLRKENLFSSRTVVGSSI